MIGSDRRATIRNDESTAGKDQTVPYGTDSRLNLFQAINCLDYHHPIPTGMKTRSDLGTVSVPCFTTDSSRGRGKSQLHATRILVHGVPARSRSFPLVPHARGSTALSLITRSTASTTSETEIRFIQRKSIGQFLKKQGLHST